MTTIDIIAISTLITFAIYVIDCVQQKENDVRNKRIEQNKRYIENLDKWSVELQKSRDAHAKLCFPAMKIPKKESAE